MYGLSDKTSMIAGITTLFNSVWFLARIASTASSDRCGLLLLAWSVLVATVSLTKTAEPIEMLYRVRAYSPGRAQGTMHQIRLEGGPGPQREGVP